MGNVGTPLSGAEVLKRRDAVAAISVLNDEVERHGKFELDKLELNDPLWATLYNLYRAAMQSSSDRTRAIMPIINAVKLEEALERHPQYCQHLRH